MTKATQPVPTVSEADVRRIVARDFPDQDAATLFAILEAYPGESLDRGAARVHVAALKLAARDLARLRMHIETARQDFRDVIAAAEYPLASATPWPDLQRMSEAEKQRMYDADWQQYERWLQRP